MFGKYESQHTTYHFDGPREQRTQPSLNPFYEPWFMAHSQQPQQRHIQCSTLNCDANCIYHLLSNVDHKIAESMVFSGAFKFH